jgi:hypothetical protein
MEPTEFKGHNKVLNKPPDMTDEECKSLPVFADSEKVVSCWRASIKERLVFLFKGILWIWISTPSGTQPPIAPVILKGDPVRWRTIWVLRGKRWKRGNFLKIKKGDIFRMYEPDGEIVSHDGSDTFLAVKDSCPSADGIDGNVVIENKPVHHHIPERIKS